MGTSLGRVSGDAGPAAGGLVEATRGLPVSFGGNGGMGGCFSSPVAGGMTAGRSMVGWDSGAVPDTACVLAASTGVSVAAFVTGSPLFLSGPDAVFASFGELALSIGTTTA